MAMVRVDRTITTVIRLNFWAGIGSEECNSILEVCEGGRGGEGEIEVEREGGEGEGREEEDDLGGKGVRCVLPWRRVRSRCWCGLGR